MSNPGAANHENIILLSSESGGFDIRDSLHSVCVMGCRLSDVWGFGLESVRAGVSTFTPHEWYWGDRKHA